jgi:hypothetical protein
MDAAQSDIFLAYAHRDRDRAAKLVESLKQEGWSVWWDPELIGGARFDRAIGEALNAAKCVVVIWSPASVESDFVFDEARTAYGRGVIVPVVFGNATPPLGFGRIQAVNLDTADGLDQLRQAVRAVLKQPPKPRPQPARRRYALVAGSAVALLAIAAAWLFGPSAEKRFRALRNQASITSASPPDVMVGVTVWRLRPSTPDDPPHTRMLTEPSAEWTPIRIQAGADLPEGSRVRLGIESSRDGYAYIIDRELGADGSTGSPKLAYPTERSRGGNDRVRRGELLQLPSPGAAIPYWELKTSRPDYAGELLTVIISPQAIAELENAPGAIPDERFAAFQRDWGGGVQRVFTGPAGATLTPAEARARTEPSRLLTQQDAAPSAIYSRTAGPDTPILVNHAIRIVPGKAKPPE